MLNDPSEAVFGFVSAGGPLNLRDFVKKEAKKKERWKGETQQTRIKPETRRGRATPAGPPSRE